MTTLAARHDLIRSLEHAPQRTSRVRRECVLCQGLILPGEIHARCATDRAHPICVVDAVARITERERLLGEPPHHLGA